MPKAKGPRVIIGAGAFQGKPGTLMRAIPGNVNLETVVAVLPDGCDETVSVRLADITISRRKPRKKKLKDSVVGELRIPRAANRHQPWWQ